MLIFPAIDLLDGHVVRLFQGDYAQKSVYGDDPARFAADFERQGAGHLHLVDLDGAKSGEPKNFGAVRDICAKSRLFVEFGGGVRSEDALLRCLEAGVSRVILGTAALRDEPFLRRMVNKHGDKIAVGVDARGGRVAVDGWLSTSDVDSVEFCKRLAQMGVQYVIYTDIARDGAQAGANLAAYEQLAGIAGLHITASGGVSTLADIRALRDMGLYAAILGKALYAGGLNLSEAIEAAGA